MENISKVCTDCAVESIICGGDFNCVIDTSKDKISSTGTYSDSSVKEIKTMMNQLKLTDVWRRLHPDLHHYTWHKICKNKPNLNTGVRLDRWLVSDGIFPEVKNCEILPCVISDHLPVILSLESLDGIKRGKGTWK